MSNTEQMQKRQKVLADFGDFALQSEDLDEVLTEACRLVGEALGTGRAKVLEIEPGGESLLVRAGVGWAADVVGQVHIPMRANSSESYAIKAGVPVITQDISQEERFGLPDFLKDAGIVALANVPIFLPGKRAYGLLQIDDTRPREFDQNDTEFLRTYATLLGPVIDRLHKLQDLRSTEERFRAFVTASNDIIYRMSPDWSELRELQGRGFLADMPGPSGGWREHYIHPDDRDMVEAAIEKAVRTKGIFELEHRVRQADGRPAWVLSRAVPIKNEDGRIIEWLGAAQDVTARCEAEEALRESEARFRTLGEALPVIVSLGDAEGRLTYVNPAWEEFSGQTASDFLQGGFRDAVHPDDRDRVLQAWQAATAARQPYSYGFRARNAAGEPRWLQAQGRPVLGPQGDVRAWVNAAIDVHDQRMVEEQVREREARQAFVLRLNDALRAEPDADAVANCALQMLFDELRLDRCYIGVYQLAADRGDFIHQVGNHRVPAVPKGVRLSDFPAALQVAFDRTLVIDDVAGAEGLTDTDRQNLAALGMGALVAATLRKGKGRPLWSIVAILAEPRHWTPSEVALIEEVTERTWTAAERARAEVALRESEERFRDIVETATDYAIFTTDAGGRIQTWPAGAQEVFGWSDEEAVGRPVEITFTPEDRETGQPEKERQEAREKGQAPNVRWHVRKDGSRVFIEGMVRPLTAPDGTVAGFLKVGQDVTARRATEAALQESEERFRQFGDASGDVLWIRNAESLEFEYVSPAVEEVYGTRAEDFLSGNQMLRWAGMIVPEDRDKALDAIRRVRAGEHVLHTFRILRRADGAVRWIRDNTFPLLDAEGRVQRIGGIGHDATEEIDLQDRQKVLVAELQHRTRNLMGVVRSVTDKTLSSSASLPDFQGRIRDRLNALGRVNSLLSRLDVGRRITFDELLLTELMAHGVVDPQGPGSQVRLDGPERIRLRSSMVQTLALGLHELATNALKYGALSRPEGRLNVTWELVNGQDGEPRLRVDWRESGVPVLTVVPDSASGGEITAPRRRGYGRELIERALPYQLKAETSYELTPDGVRCTITLPVSSTMSGDGETAKEGSDG